MRDPEVLQKVKLTDDQGRTITVKMTAKELRTMKKQEGIA